MNNDQPPIYAFDIVGARSSGARFFAKLTSHINGKYKSSFDDARVVLFNIYAPISKVLAARLRGKKVILRVDGLWNDRLSPAFLENVGPVSRHIFAWFGKFGRTRNLATHLANFFFDNYKSFVKILMAHEVIYQSEYSKKLHDHYYAKKSSVVLNASPWMRPQNLKRQAPSLSDEIRICQIYSRAPLKGIYESLLFVRWLAEEKNLKVKLHLFGYSGVLPPGAPDDMKMLLEDPRHVVLYPEFTEYDQATVDQISHCHFFLWLSRADPCPNALIECMGCGLPVMGLTSGGVPEIVGGSGVLVPFDDYDDGFFFGSRYEYIRPNFSFNELFEHMMLLFDTYDDRLRALQDRFDTELGLPASFSRYEDRLLKAGGYSV